MARCRICRAELPSYDPPRAGSRFDRFCNQMINPRHVSRERMFGDGSTWAMRAYTLRKIHNRLRGGEPGWGGYSPRQLRYVFANWYRLGS